MKRKYFTARQKKDAVEKYRNTSAASAAIETGISKNTIKKWVQLDNRGETLTTSYFNVDENGHEIENENENKNIMSDEEKQKYRKEILARMLKWATSASFEEELKGV